VNAHAAWWAAPLLASLVVFVGAYIVGVLDAVVTAVVARSRLDVGVATRPVRRAAVLLVQQPATTERPDAAAWMLAPALYVALAAVGVVVVPWSPSFAIADLPAGVVLWGTVESLVVVALFLHGWSANSHQPLLAAYRFLAVGLSYLLLSMFVLIAAAVPARSLALSDIVASQADLWNVVRQPLGLPLFAVVALGSASWGPLNIANGADLSAGTTADTSGAPLLVWQFARAATLTAFAAISTTVFLGGWTGPLLPDPVWVAVKTVAVLAVLVTVGHLRARVRAERFVTLAWTVLLPLAFADLVIAGLEALR
jgi:NADH-quinone oxidoreductase subunit H